MYRRIRQCCGQGQVDVIHVSCTSKQIWSQVTTKGTNEPENKQNDNSRLKDPVNNQDKITQTI